MRKLNDRIIRAIVAGGSLTMLVAIGLPLVDEARDIQEANRTFVEQEKEYQSTQQRSDRLDRIEQTLQLQKQELTNRNVTPKDISKVRDEIIEMVRKYGGSLRSLEIQDGQMRAWAADGDDPHNRDIPEFGNESEFELHSHGLALSVVGPLESVLGIAQSLSKRHWLLSIEAMDLKPEGTDSHHIGLVMSITLFGLEMTPPTHEENLALLN